MKGSNSKVSADCKTVFTNLKLIPNILDEVNNFLLTGEIPDGWVVDSQGVVDLTDKLVLWGFQ